jgi:hypothetical protein
VRTIDWPDDKVAGNVGGATVNAAPDTCAELTVTDAPDTDSVTFCVAVEPTCVGLKVIVALFAVIVPTAGGTELLVTLPEHPVMSTTESASTETIEFALFDRRSTMGHRSPPARAFLSLEALKLENRENNVYKIGSRRFPGLGRTSTWMREL